MDPKYLTCNAEAFDESLMAYYSCWPFIYDESLWVLNTFYSGLVSAIYVREFWSCVGISVAGSVFPQIIILLLLGLGYEKYGNFFFPDPGKTIVLIVAAAAGVAVGLCMTIITESPILFKYPKNEKKRIELEFKGCKVTNMPFSKKKEIADVNRLNRKYWIEYGLITAVSWISMFSFSTSRAFLDRTNFKDSSIVRSDLVYFRIDCVFYFMTNAVLVFCYYMINYSTEIERCYWGGDFKKYNKLHGLWFTNLVILFFLSMILWTTPTIITIYYSAFSLSFIVVYKLISIAYNNKHMFYVEY